MLKPNKTKEVLAGLFIAIFAISTAACSNTGITTTPAPTQDPNFIDGPMVKYKESVEITVSNVTSSTFTFVDGDTEDDNIHTRMNKQYLNIVYKSKWVVAEAKLDEKINLAIASNDLPDALNVNASQAQSLIKNGQVQDLTQVWAKYPTEEFKKNEEYQNGVAFIPVKEGEKIYGIPLTGDFGESVPLMYIRKDWLANVGMKAPATIDELVNVSKAFIHEDPDGNSKKDTYAIALDSSLGTTTMDSIAAAYKAYNKMWIKNSAGEIVYGSVQPEMKNALGLMQELFRMGAFDPEFAVKDGGKVTETLAAGKIGIYFGIYSGPISTLMQNKINEPTADWAVLPIPTAKSTDIIIPPAKAFAQRWVVIRKEYTHPEAVVKSMNLWFSTNYDNETPEYKEWMDANSSGGKYEGRFAQVYSKPYYFQSVNGNLSISEKLLYARDTGDKSKLNAGGLVLVSMIEKGDPLGWAMAKVYYESEVVVGNYKTNLKYADYNGTPTTTMISKGASLDKLEAEVFIKIIMGASLSEFDDFAEKWHRLGGDQIAKEIKESLE